MNNFNNLLNEAYDLLKEEDIKKKHITLSKIDIEITATRLHWKNILEYITLLNVDNDHFYDFIKNELCSYIINWYSSEKKDGIIIHGKNLKHLPLNNLIKKYINNYVVCSSCKGINSEIKRTTPKTFQYTCKTCGVVKNYVRKN